LESVEVVQRDDAGRALICDTVTDARVTKVRCRVRVVYEAPRRLEFVRVSSDDVDELRGSWELAEVPGGRTTLVTYSMAVDPGPVGLLARPLERALRPLVVGGRPAELAEAVRRRFPAAPHGPDG
ncbi:MAG: SRPBCC family protein, partial [Solirubrobacteraceae bacterium]